MPWPQVNDDMGLILIPARPAECRHLPACVVGRTYGT